jgi:hypothetical protein
MEKVMEMIYSASFNLHDYQTIAGRKRRIIELEQHINTIAFGSIEDQATIPFPSRIKQKR